MKKILVTVGIIIIVFCLIAIPPLLQPALPSSQGTPQPTPNSTPQTVQPTPQSNLQPTPQSTIQITPEPNPQDTLQPTPQTTLQPSNCTLQQAIANATSFLETVNEPYAMLMLNVAYRRFQIAAFADCIERYDQALIHSSFEEAQILRIFRRIAVYNNQPQISDFKAVVADIDLVTVPALYCDRSGLPENYALTLNQALNGGDYLKTHVLLATIWMQDNNYHLSMPSGFTENLYQFNAALIGNDPVVTDVELEAATFLYMAGQGSMVNAGFIQKVIATQNIDGGWSTSTGSPDGSHWHSSVLGLLLLLHVQYPSDSYPPMLAPAPD